MSCQRRLVCLILIGAIVSRDILADSYSRGAGYPYRFLCEHDKIGSDEEVSSYRKVRICERWATLWYPVCKEGYHNVACCVCSNDKLEDVFKPLATFFHRVQLRKDSFRPPAPYERRRYGPDDSRDRDLDLAPGFHFSGLRPSSYRRFLDDCPTGRMTVAHFKEQIRRTYPFGDPEGFAEQVFRNYDANLDGTVDFLEFMCGLGTTSRGTFEQKLRWTFRLYDIDGNGHITKQEMIKIFSAIYKFRFSSPAGQSPFKKDDTPVLVTNEMFHLMDKNQDEVVSLDEFLAGCRSMPHVAELLHA